MPTGHRFLATDLHQFVVSLFTHLGSTPGEATLVADHLIAANLAGHDSHGVGMIPSYVKSHAGGFLQLNRHATVTKDAGAVVTLDGNAGFGQVVAHEAMQLGIEKAKQHGMAAIALRNAHHVGRIGYWAEQCAAAGLPISSSASSATRWSPRSAGRTAASAPTRCAWCFPARAIRRCCWTTPPAPSPLVKPASPGIKAKPWPPAA